MAGFSDPMEDVDALPQEAIHIILITSLEQLDHLFAGMTCSVPEVILLLS